MEITPIKPTPELNHLISSALQNSRFKERRQREAGTDVQNQVVYFSPVIRINPETQNVVIQYRDTETGDITNEYPDLPEKIAAYVQNSAHMDQSQAMIPIADTDAAINVVSSSENTTPTISIDERV